MKHEEGGDVCPTTGQSGEDKCGSHQKLMDQAIAEDEKTVDEQSHEDLHQIGPDMTDVKSEKRDELCVKQEDMAGECNSVKLKHDNLWAILCDLYVSAISDSNVWGII